MEPERERGPTNFPAGESLTQENKYINVRFLAPVNRTLVELW